MSRKVEVASQVNVGLELRFLAQHGGTVAGGATRRAAPSVFAPGETHRVAGEVVAGMRQMLTRMIATGEWPAVVALTSALRREGVTYTALALSAVLSQDTAGPVCLVDTNWYWPSLPGNDSEGLAAVLDGELDLDRALMPVDVATEPAAAEPAPAAGSATARTGSGGARLMLLPAGRMPLTRRVVAARSPELKAIVAALRQQFENVILDVPALSATSDAIALAGLADACAMVVHQGVTPAAVVQESLAAIRHLPVAGVILNRVQVHMPASLAGPLTAPAMSDAG